ncbi:hypothetical protein SAMN04489860_2328 [Paraoerskovia marina]|uniref:General stress protein 17M-like domain-containing protein n=1 Tax=Paraoerskovia marina TaxID=545619 RepID=A0A1H1UX43_9CELL|nr:general stress protein [Paraoerskovia marina]SDS77168.1 hypothetical protein SAMN04489860_2328 [Paraoerskovia marina]
MSMTRPNTVPRIPTLPRGDVIATYPTYLEAQKAVDYLSDSRFAVEYVTILGSDLKMVERVIGRLTYGRVALAGLASGAWFGLFVGLLLMLFGSTGGGAAAGGIVLTAVALGAGFGMLFSVLTFALSGRKRDFSSSSQIVASEYSILCAPERSDEARLVLHRMNQGAPANGQGSGHGAGQGTQHGADSQQPPAAPRQARNPDQPFAPPSDTPPQAQPPAQQAPPAQPQPSQTHAAPSWPSPDAAPSSTEQSEAAPAPERKPDPRFVTSSGAPRYGAMLSDYSTKPTSSESSVEPVESTSASSVESVESTPATPEPSVEPVETTPATPASSVDPVETTSAETTSPDAPEGTPGDENARKDDSAAH